MMMSCEAAREHLADAILGEVDDRVEAELNEHLRACAACRAEELALLRCREELREVPEVPPALAARIRLAAREAFVPRDPLRAPETPTSGGFWAWLRRPVPAYAAAAAILLTVLFLRAIPTVRSETETLRPVLLAEQETTRFVPAAAEETAIWASLPGAGPGGVGASARDSL